MPRSDSPFRHLSLSLFAASSLFVAAPATADIVINEVMQNPSAVSDSAGEWFEIVNTGDTDVDIDGWTLADEDIDSHVIDNGGPLLVPAGGYLVLGNNADSATNGGVPVDYAYGGSFFLSNGADELLISDATSTLVDRIAWDGGAVWPDPNGAAMALSDPALDNADGANWCEAGTPYGDGDLGTPGAPNDCAPATANLVINEIMQNPSAVSDGSGEWFELFNAGATAVDLEGWTFKDDGSDSFGVVGSLVIPAGGYRVFGNNADPATNGGVAVDYDYGSGFFLANGGDELVLIDPLLNEVDRVAWDNGATFPDPNGAAMALVNPTLDNALGVNWCEAATPYGDGDAGTPGAANDCGGADSAPLVINEIMQNPSAVSDSDGEWFELFNPGGEAVDIEGWTIRDNDFDSHVIASGGPLLVPAGGYLVLGNNADGAGNGGVPVAYAYAGVFLANGGDELVLLDGSGVEVDRAEWDGGPVWPDPNGAAMALSDPALDNNDGANWCEASTPYGAGDAGTPGAANDCDAPPGGDFGVCGDAFTPVYAVQGSGFASPISGQVVNVEGVVTGDFQGADGLDGFFLQDETGDGDAATSDGVFVRGLGFGAVDEGDRVRLRGTAGERFDQTVIQSLTDLVVCGDGVLPAPAPVTLPQAAPGELERFEGMFVAFEQPLFVSGNFGLGRFGEVDLALGGPLDNPTNVVAPGPDALALQAANDLRRVVLDDGSNAQNPVPVPYLGPEDTLRTGDRVTGLTGILTFDFGQYRVHPLVAPVIDHFPRPAAPPAVGGLVQVASFNVLNYFTTLDTGASAGTCGPAGDAGCRGADSATELARQRAKLVDAIVALDAEVVGLIELENGAGDAPLVDLVDGLNAALGAGVYDYVATGDIGSDTIRVGLIYQPAKVAPVGGFAILDDGFDPAYRADRNRPALAQTFAETTAGSRFTVVVNHLKSKGSDCDDIGDPDLGDGQGNCNLTRTAAAELLVDWLATDPTGAGTDQALIVGDLNAYAQEDPVRALEDGGYADLVEQFVGTGYADGAYSFNFFAQSGYLDHGLASPALLPLVTGAGIWNINADEPRVKDYNEEFKQPGIVQDDRFRSSDHDVVVVGLLPDGDDDGIDDTADACPSTVLPDEAAALRLGRNRWADTDGDGIFESSARNEARRGYTLADTAGCSCAQIVAACGLGRGHLKFGCSNGVMDRWTGLFDAAGNPPLSCDH